MANFAALTRYTNGNIFKDRSEKDFVVLRRNLFLEASDDDTFVTITQQFIGRPDLIGDTAYGDRALWWVIFEFNNIRDPLFDLKLGQIIRLPSKGRVLDAINSLNKV